MGRRALSKLWLSLVFLFAGCPALDPDDETGAETDTNDSGDTAVDTDSGDTSDTDTYVDTGPPPSGGPCAALGFHPAAISWNIPYRADELKSGFHSALDLTGDGRPDFVQSDREWTSTAPNLGVDHWRVFPNNGNGFLDASIEWSLPVPENSSLDVRILLEDLDGDALIDMVRLDEHSGSTAAVVGVTEWQTHRNTGAGFEDAHGVWTLPFPLDRRSGDGFKVVDLDGDGHRDIVRTAPMDGETDDELGVSVWRLYRFNGTGFDAEPMDWPLPISMKGLVDFEVVLRDIDSDGRPDLVQTQPTQEVPDASLGVSEWRVYHNTSTGFAAGTSWSLPYPTKFYVGPSHLLDDLDEDGVVDFVQTDVDSTSNDPAIGSTEWRVYRGTGAGFSPTGESWPVPYPLPAFENSSHGIIDMNGDGFRDLVQHYSEGGVVDPSIGVTEWRVHLSACGD